MDPRAAVAIILALTVAIFAWLSVWLNNPVVDAKTQEWGKVLAVIVGALAAYISGGDKK